MKKHILRKSNWYQRKTETSSIQETEEILDFDSLDKYAIKVKQNELKSTPAQNVEQFPDVVKFALQKFLRLQRASRPVSLDKHSINPNETHEEDHLHIGSGSDHNDLHHQNVDRIVKSVFHSFKEKKSKEFSFKRNNGQKIVEDMNEIKIEVNETEGIKLTEENNGLSSIGLEGDFAEDTNSRFRIKEVTRELKSPCFNDNK